MLVDIRYNTRSKMNDTEFYDIGYGIVQFD